MVTIQNNFSMKDLKCEQVMIFKDRADIKRSIKIKLDKGENELFINNVSNFIDKETIRLEGQGDAIVLDVICQSKNIEIQNIQNNDKGKQLLNEIRELEILKEKLEAKIIRLEKQATFLNQFGLNLAQSKDDHVDTKDVSNLFKFLDSYTKRLEYLDFEKTKIKEDLLKTEDELKVVNENYRRLNIYDFAESM
jgi:hypothetical protein